MENNEDKRIVLGADDLAGTDMDTLRLTKEFEQAKFKTMTSVINAVTMKIYIDRQMQGVQIPTFLIDQKELQYRASEVAEHVLNKVLANGELETAFEESWQAVAEFLP